MAESGLNVNAENAAEKAGNNSAVKPNQYGIGIGQWTGKRHDDYVKWIGSHGNSLQSQLDFTIDEIQRKYPKFLETLRSAETPEEASDYTYAMYTAANHTNVNKNNIQSILDRIARMYDANHRQTYGRTFNNHADRRRGFALDIMGYKIGGILKAQGGTLFPPNENREIRFIQEQPKPYQSKYDLSINPFENTEAFYKWYQYYSRVTNSDPNPDAPEHHYDYRGYFDEIESKQHQYDVITPDIHLPDTYKLPGHETFSIESKYYKPGMMAGHWEGDNFVPIPFSLEEMEARQQYAETRFKRGKVSQKGARGAYQFVPRTWHAIQTKYGLKGDIENYNDNKEARDLHFDELYHNDLIRFANEPSRIALTYAAYNMGVGNLKSFIEKEQNKGVDVYNTWDWIDDLNPETKNYVNFIVRGIDGNGDLTNSAFNKALPNRFNEFPEVNNN